MKEGQPLNLPEMEQDNPLDYLEPRQTYADKGSHKARSDFWKDLRRQERVPTEDFIDKTIIYERRRFMPRMPKDGK